MQKFFSSLIVFLFFCCDVAFCKETVDFYKLMGKGKEIWSFVSKEDLKIVEQFAEGFRSTQDKTASHGAIPKKIHFIWVGPKEFPFTSIKNVYSWIEKHPECEVILWSDRIRALPHSQMKLQLIEEFPWLFLKREFEESNNYGEKSDLLRYEILYQQGGIYVDHDVECFRSFQDILKGCNLFCGIEFPHHPLAETSITVCNNLIGSIPFHPIIKKTIRNVLEKWETYTILYPDQDVDSVTKRVYYRTFSSFDDAVKELAPDKDYVNKVFPAGYFNKLGKEFGLYAHHYYNSTWFEGEDVFEKNVRQRLVKICKKHNQLMLISLGSFFIMMIFVILLFLQVRDLKNVIKDSSIKR